ncbi:MAG: hypothetical protein ACKOOD_05195 [Microbacteriaceae bacterium]
MTHLPLLDDLELLFRNESAARRTGGNPDEPSLRAGRLTVLLKFANETFKLNSAGIGRGFVVGFDERDQLTFCSSTQIFEIELVTKMTVRQSALVRELVTSRIRLSKWLGRLAGAQVELQTQLGNASGRIEDVVHNHLVLAASATTLVFPLSAIMRCTILC